MTINQIVERVKPDYITVYSTKGNGTLIPGSAEVSSVHIDFDPVDGICMYVTVM